MKKSKLLILVLILISSTIACKKPITTETAALQYQCPMQCKGIAPTEKPGLCTVCNMKLTPVETAVIEKKATDEISENSIFNLTSTWKTEENKEIVLKDLKGKTLVMVMIYTTCKAACPRLVADMRNIEAQIPKAQQENIQYVLVSIDPENDNPKRLKSFAIENYMNGKQWTFLQGKKSSVREFANVLAVKYKEISPIDFSHSNIISVFNTAGELVHQQEGLGVDNKETVATIIKTSK